jgi:soluble P-type ATPase
MIEVAIPGYRKQEIEHLVLDYNGTLACDGELIDGVREGLQILADRLKVHVLTADTFGRARSRLEGIPCELSVLPVKNQEIGKLTYVRRLGPANAVCIGNGRNDQLMLKESALGICVILAEGAAVETLLAADVVCTSIVSALALLTHPLRLTATLRS